MKYRIKWVFLGPMHGLFSSIILQEAKLINKIVSRFSRLRDRAEIQLMI